MGSVCGNGHQGSMEDLGLKCKQCDRSILDEAKEITGGERMKAYGHPKHNFKDIARLWSAYLQNKGVMDGTCLEPKDVALMMTLFKIAREQAGHKRDNLVDGAGYIRNAAQIEGIE